MGEVDARSASVGWGTLFSAHLSRAIQEFWYFACLFFSSGAAKFLSRAFVRNLSPDRPQTAPGSNSGGANSLASSARPANVQREVSAVNFRSVRTSLIFAQANADW